MLGDPRVTGYHLTVSWALTGEMRRYNRRNGLFDRLPVARSVYQNGWGSWELATRWSSLDATDGGLDGGELDILSAGVNWWLTPFFHVSFNYRWITLDRLGVSGDSHGFNSRVMLLLE